MDPDPEMKMSQHGMMLVDIAWCCVDSPSPRVYVHPSPRCHTSFLVFFGRQDWRIESRQVLPYQDNSTCHVCHTLSSQEEWADTKIAHQEGW